jgi:hypothetical protein
MIPGPRSLTSKRLAVLLRFSIQSSEHKAEDKIPPYRPPSLAVGAL